MISKHTMKAGLGALALAATLSLAGCAGEHVLVDLLQDGSTPVDDHGRVEIALDGYGYRWLRVVAPGSRRLV